MRLLALGPLTTSAFVEITGWPRRSAAWVLAQLRAAGKVRMVRRGEYEVCR
jgi:hypothetical protein